eukprot:s2400_g2.t1
MWVTDSFLELMAQYGDSIFGVSFHPCMFGSSRKKQTALWTSVQELQQLHRLCDESHQHAPWGVTNDGSFATAEECAYDPQLCAHWAEAAVQYATRLGYQAPPSTLQDVAADHLHVKDQANRAILGARFELMRCALEAVGYPDSCIAAEASAGLPLVGWMKQSGMFASNLRPPELQVDSLENMAASFSGRSIASIKASSDAEMDREVWEATLAEVAGGTLDGPYELDCLPSGHVVSPRFCIRQGQEVRPIDNLTASGINATVGLPERLQVDTIDEVAALVKRCMQGYGTASVASFLRVSRALKELGIRGGALMWSSFFDDFICITRPEDAVSADMTIRREELSALVGSFLAADRLTCGESESLRSRLTSAEAQIFGRSAKMALRAVGSVRFFGFHIPDGITSVWAGDGRKQLFFEAEVLPYLLALTCWSDILGGRHLLVFIDNDGARHSWVKGGADSIHALRMIHQGTLLEARMDVSPYFCRVPTRSNLDDGPSHLDFALCRALGATETKVPHETLRRCALWHGAS